MTTTTTITTTEPLLTLVNVFTVAPERQQELVDLLAEATATLSGLPGFVSANLHRSHDGQRVVNYAQWRSQQDYDAMRSAAGAAEHMERAAQIATFDPIFCDVVFSDHG